MNGNHEEIRLDADESGVVDGTKKANAALEGFEKKAESANKAVQDAFEKTGEVIARVSTRSQTSANRIAASVRRRADALEAQGSGDPLAGERLRFSQDVQRLAGDPKTLTEVTAQYERIFAIRQKIAKQDIASANDAETKRMLDSLKRQGDAFEATVAQRSAANEREVSRMLDSLKRQGDAFESQRTKNIAAANEAEVQRMLASLKRQGSMFEEQRQKAAATVDRLRESAIQASRAADLKAKAFTEQLAAAESRERSVRALEGRVARSNGPLAALQFERAEAIRQLGNDIPRINRVAAAYDQLIAKQKAVTVGTFDWVAAVRRVAAVYASIALIVGALGTAAFGAVTLADQAKKVEVFFAKTYDSVELAKKSVVELRTIARDSSIFDIRSIQESAKQLVAFGFTASQVPRVLRAIGDAAAVLGEDRLQRITIALGQIQTKGRVQAQELLQLQEAGIAATEILAKGFGRSQAEMLKLVEKGVVPARESIDLLLSGIEGKFGGIDRQFNNSATGLINQIKQNFQEIGIELGRIFDTPTRSALKAVNDLLSRVREFAKEVKGINVSLVDAITPGAIGTKVVNSLAPDNLRGGFVLGEIRNVIKINAEAQRSKNFIEGKGLELVKQRNAELTKQRQLEQDNSVWSQINARYALKNAEADQARSKAAEEAAKNAERLQDILSRLGDERDAAFMGFKSADADIARLNVKLAETRRALQDVGASRGQQELAEGLIRQRFALEQLMQKRREADAERTKFFQKQAEEDMKAVEYIDRIREARQQADRERFERVDRLFQQNLDAEAQDTIAAVDREKQIRIAGISEVNRLDIAGQIASVQQKLAIEQEFLDQKTRLELEQIQRKRAIEIAALEDARTLALFRNDAQGVKTITDQIKSVTNVFDAQERRLNQSRVTEKILLETDAARQISQIQADSQQRVFQEWKDSLSRTIDALTTRFEGWGKFLKTFWQAFLIAPAKEFAATMGAAILTGQNPQRALFAGGTGTGRSLGIFGTLFGGANGGGVLGGGLGNFGIGTASAPGGTGTFTGAPIPGLGGSPGATGGILQSLSLNLTGFKSILQRLGGIGMGSGSTDSLGGVYSGPLGGTRGIGGAKGGALLAGGAILAMDGLRRRSLVGAFETAAGGALIGAKFGGPIGAAIGAGVGFGAGLVSMLFKKAEDKAKSLIKQIYGVDIKEKNILRQFIDIAKTQFGGDLRLALYSQQARDLIELYKLSQGDRSGLAAASPRQFNLMQTSAGLFQQMQPAGAFPTVSAIAPPSPTMVNVTISGDDVQRVFEGYTVRAVASNPRAVAVSAAAGQRSSHGRFESAGAILEPGTLFT